MKPRYQRWFPTEFPGSRQRRFRRYIKVPVEGEWATDPIANRLKDRASPELRQSVVRFAAEAQTKREKR
jgi:hypothetical protein